MAVTSTHCTLYSIPDEVFLSCVFPYLTCQGIVGIGRTCKWGRALLEDGFTQRLFCLRQGVPEGFWCGTWKKTRVQWLRLILGKEPLEHTKTTAKTDRLAVGLLCKSERAEVHYKGVHNHFHQFYIADPKGQQSSYEVNTEGFCDVAVIGTDILIIEGCFSGGYRTTHVDYYQSNFLTIQLRDQFLALDPLMGALSLLNGSKNSGYLSLVLGVNISLKNPNYRLEPIEQNELHISGIFIFPNYFISFATRRRVMSDCNDKLVIWKLEKQQGIRMVSHSLDQQFSRPVRLDLEDNILEIYAAGRFACEVKLYELCSDTEDSPDSIAIADIGSEIHPATKTIEIGKKELA